MCLLAGVCNDVDIDVQIMKRTCTFVNAMLSSNMDKVGICISNAIHGSPSAICNSINTICQKFNLVKSDIIVNNRKNIPIHNVSTHNYCSLLVRELCLIRDDNLVLDVFDYNEILEAIAHLCTN